MGPTEAVARFVAECDLANIPEEVSHKAKLALADCLGVALAGVGFPSSDIVLDYVRSIGGAPQAAVIGTDLRASLADAALANGMLSSALLYDDTSLAMHGHSTATLLPVVLALGESLGASGRAALEAYLVGFEVEATLGVALEPEHYERGWHATATIGTMGATAAACRLLSLPADTVRMAFGIAASMAGGTRQNFGTMMQAFHGGLPARNGVVAAELARRGFTADPNILESRMGFFNLFGSETRKVTAATEALGRDWAMARPILAMKLYPCGFPVHRPIEGAIELATEHDIAPEEVEEIRVGLHYLLPETVFHENPQTGLQGKTSIPYCAARALIDRRMGLAQFTDEKVRDPAVRRLMAKVKVEVPPELSREQARHINSIAAPAFMTVTLSGGRTVTKRIDYYRGDPMRPLSDDDVAEKFRDCAGTVLDGDRVEALLGCLGRLETVASAGEIVALATP